MSNSYCSLDITGFTAAPPGWRVAWIDAECDPPRLVTAPMAGWITGTDPETGSTIIEAATHCPGLIYGEAPSSVCVYPASEAAEYPSGVWKILGPGEPLPDRQEVQDEARLRTAIAENRWQREHTALATVVAAEWTGDRWLLDLRADDGRELHTELAVTPEDPEALGIMFRTLGALGISLPPARPFWEAGIGAADLARQMTGSKVRVMLDDGTIEPAAPPLGVSVGDSTARA